MLSPSTEYFVPDPQREAELRAAIATRAALPDDWDREGFGMKYHYLRTATGALHSQVARYLDVSAPAVKQWGASGKSRPATISAPNLLKLADYFGAPLEWLLFAPIEPSPVLPERLPKDASHVVREPDAVYPPVQLTHPAPETISLPYLTVPLSAGNGSPLDWATATAHANPDAPRYVVARAVLAQVRRSACNLVAVAVHGDSMEPLLRDGDTVIVDVGDRTVADGRVFAVRIDNEVYVKKVVRAPSLGHGALRLVSLSPEYPEIVLVGESLTSCEILGRVCYRAGLVT